MKKYLLSSLLIFSTGLVLADGHSADEKKVLSKISEYLMQEQIKIGKQLFLTKVNQVHMELILMAVSISH